jgi:hypothetical protein
MGKPAGAKTIAGPGPEAGYLSATARQQETGSHSGRNDSANNRIVSAGMANQRILIAACRMVCFIFRSAGSA